MNMSFASYHLIIDLEATCCNDNSFLREEMEIIEIGAVILSEPKLEIIAEFQTFICPILHSKLTDFCKNLTTISQDDVDNAPKFKEALQLFSAWFMQLSEFDFCSWGNYDKNQLEQDCKLHNTPLPFEAQHRNLKQEFSNFLGVKKQFGLSKALAKLKLTQEGTHHRGIDDARNTARIYQYMYLNKDISIHK